MTKPLDRYPPRPGQLVVLGSTGGRRFQHEYARKLLKVGVAYEVEHVSVYPHAYYIWLTLVRDRAFAGRLFKTLPLGCERRKACTVFDLALSRICNVDPAAVSRWRSRGRLPAARLATVRAALTPVMTRDEARTYFRTMAPPAQHPEAA